MKQRILIVSVSFYPRISPRSFRATELAKEFARQGHEVVVLTHMGCYDYTEFCKEHNLAVKDFTAISWQHENKTKRGNKLYYLHALGMALFKYLFLWPDIKLSFLLAKALKKESGYDLLISLAVPYPVHWGVVKAIQQNPALTKKWIADCGDPFLKYKSGLQKPFYFKYIDNWFLKNAEIITIPYEQLLTYFNPKHHKKFKFIPQGFDFSDIKLAKYKKNNVPTFAYAGAFIKNFRDPRLFLDFLVGLNAEFKFYIYTRNYGMLEYHKKQLGEKLIIDDYIPRNELLYQLSKMDFLVNIQNGNKKDYPSKLIDYSITGRPILNINSYVLAEDNIIDFFKGSYSKSIAHTNIQQYNIQSVANQFIVSA